VRLDKLGPAISEIGTLLDQAEAAHGPARDGLLRQAAVRACRALNEAVPRDDLREAGAALQEARQRGGGQMRQLLDRNGKFADLVAAECRLLVLIGVRSDLVERIGHEMWSVELDEVPHFVEVAEALRTAVCDLPTALAAAGSHERKKSKVWGAAMGLAALALGGGNTALTLVFAPAAAASGVLAAALAEHALNRVLRGE
jgi:hypothetical protein